MKQLAKAVNTKLSANFSSKEFDCKCRNPECKQTLVSDRLVDILQEIRQHFASSVTITSAFRCAAHNNSIGGAKSSQHLAGTAVDIKVSKRTPKEVYDFLDKKYPNELGLGLYNSWTHVDVRSNKSRWNHAKN